MTTEKRLDIHDRALMLAIKAAKLVDRLPNNKRSAYEYGKQLIRSSASIGSNMQEADGALSKRDFLNKLGIARKEAKETHYWLLLIKEVINKTDPEYINDLYWLLNESREIKLILSKIIINTRANSGIGH